MSRFLARWGRYAATHSWRVLALWGVALIGLAALLATQPKEISTHLTIADTPAQQVLDEVTAELPMAGGTQGTIVFTAKDGGAVDGPTQMAAMGAAMDRLHASEYVVDKEERVAGQRAELSATVKAKVAEQMRTAVPSGSRQQPSRQAIDTAVKDATATALNSLDTLMAGTNPQGTTRLVGAAPGHAVTVATDRSAAVAGVQLTEQLGDLPEGTMDDLLASLGNEVASAGLTVSPSASLTPTEPPIGGHEAIGVAIAVIVLWVSLGSLVAAGLPVLTALAGVALGVGGAFAFSSHYVMTTSTPVIGLMLGLAVGIDYALFIAHKHRAILADGEPDVAASIGRATGTAGSSVLFAGLTVVIALLGLLTLGIAFITTMAVTAAVTVSLAVLISLTALPALLGLVGERLRPRRARARAAQASAAAAGSPDPAGAAAEPEARPRRDASTWWVGVTTGHPWVTIAAVSLGLLVLAAPATGLALGMPSGSVAGPGDPKRVSYDGVTSTLGEGANGPLVVTLRPFDTAMADQQQLLSWQEDLGRVADVANVQLAGSNDDHSLIVWQVIPRRGPTDASTDALVHDLRGLTLEHAGALGVTGLTAVNIDLSQRLGEALPIYLSIVVGLSLIVLLIVFRSVAVPVMATGGFLLAIAATMGLVVLAFSTDGFTWMVGGDRAGPVLSFLPIMVTGILYGLAMDYQVFLGSSIREDHVHGTPAREAVRTGFVHASKVVIAAAIIMVSVFAGFVLTDDLTIRQFGFALATGILIDAFLIRMTLVPAVMAVTGEHAWWIPRWLDRVLPRVDVEGTALRKDPPVPHDTLVT